MTKWTLWVTREVVLLERYLRVIGYSEMFGKISESRVVNMLVVNNDGLTRQYVDKTEIVKLGKIIWREYKEEDSLKKLIPYWEKIFKDFRRNTKAFIVKPTAESFRNLTENYRLGRAVIFYTNSLSKILEEKRALKDIKTIGYWHETAERETSYGWDKLKPAFKKLGKKMGVHLDDLFFYIPDEIADLLNYGKKIESKIIRLRKHYYVLLLNNKGIKLFLGQKAKLIEKKELSLDKYDKNVQILKGRVAYEGYAKGKVRIVNTESQMKKMKTGEILVSTMTTPRLMIAVKKSSAIVTEEGGITSHAAIVSREFKIPTIIGTKIATKIFKDGDLVEVDANNGTVKKI